MNRLLWLLPLLLLSSCSRVLYSGPQLHLVYDDFGPEAVVSSWLGPRGQGREVIVHHGPTRDFGDALYVHVAEAMRHLRASARRLPPGDPARQRMSTTYARLYDLYRTRRDAIMATPFPAYGRGGMNRAAMMPLMPLTL